MGSTEFAAQLEAAGLLPDLLLDRTGEPYEVRSPVSSDREPLEAFYRGFEPKRSAQGLPPAEPERIARWLDDVLPHGMHILLLRGGELVGHAFLVETSRPGTMEYAVFVGQAARGRGLGSALNQLTVAAARAAGVQRIWLTVKPYNRPALRSYERAGFSYRQETIYGPEMEMELVL
jgi:RimJ/RimL family protein N-acetyltransferase